MRAYTGIFLVTLYISPNTRVLKFVNGTLKSTAYLFNGAVDGCGPLDAVEDYASLKMGDGGEVGMGQAASSVVRSTPPAYLFHSLGIFFSV
jgi:hypothetical protein